jgi:beta-phosphoglucomutase-like phosphatase (HAD superfamily)
VIKGILFDKDGTLLRFDELWDEATKMVMPKFLNKIDISADEKGSEIRWKQHCSNDLQGYDESSH